MTDQNNAPERIWLRVTDKTVMERKPSDADEYDVEYIRAGRVAPEALEHLRNVMGHIDTPIARRHLRINEDQPEWLTEAREFLAALPLETNGE